MELFWFFGFMFDFSLKFSKGKLAIQKSNSTHIVTNRKKEQWKKKFKNNQMEDAKNSNSELYEIITALFIEEKKLAQLRKEHTTHPREELRILRKL